MKKEAAFVGVSQRCDICDTVLTLYPKDFAPCPHCRKNVCRQCWGGSWAGKAFAAEACSHMAENDGLTMTPVEESRKGLHLDWQRAVFALVLGGLAVGILIFLLNLFVF
jgi:hypothetical protein